MLRKFTFAFFFVFISFLNVANAVESKQLPFKINLKDIVDLKANKNIASYKIIKVSEYGARIEGKLKDESDFNITLKGGNVFTITQQKIIENPNTPAIKDKAYWRKEILNFAKIMWKPSEYEFLLQDINQFKISIKNQKNESILKLEKYYEGNFKELKIIKLPEKTIIELHQAAC